MSKLNVIFGYIKTIALAIFAASIALIILLSVLQHNVYEDTAKKEAKDDTIEYYLIGVLIEKNKYLELKDPKDYRINIKLGILYEIYRDYANSEAEYKLAIEKAPYGEYKPVYKLASLYISQNRLDEAQKLMDDIKEKPDKQLIKYKAEVYFKIGEKDYNAGLYATAIEKYHKSLFYYDCIHSSKVETIKESLASAHVYLAEKHVGELKIQEAIDSLIIANSLVKAPIIKYKLALLLIKNDPDLAYKYFEEVFEEEPSIIDFDVYYNFLIALSQAANAVGDTAESELYEYKAEKFKEYFQNNIISVDDVKIETASGIMTVNRWTGKCNLHLEVQLKNTSKSKLNSLFAYITFKDGSEIITDYTQQVVDVKSPLAAGTTGPVIIIKTSKKLDKFEKPPKDITAEIYVSKIEKSYKIYLTTVPIKEAKKKVKTRNRNWRLN